jgi:serine/threonine protein kinase
MPKNVKLKERCGTPAYIAPEILRCLPYDGTMADVWSIGVVLYAMLYGNFPFRAESPEDLEALILSGKYALPEDISVEARNLLRRILCQEPRGRPTVLELLSDPWVLEAEEDSKAPEDS